MVTGETAGSADVASRSILVDREGRQVARARAQAYGGWSMP